MFTEDQKEEIIDFLIEVEGTVYLGCDSIKYRTRAGDWFAKYGVALVVHKDNSKGCKVFGYTDTEKDYDVAKKPRMRLMTEAHKVTECYLEFAEILEGRDVEIHLDLNDDEQYASNAVAKQAVGYVLGVTGVTTLIKPEAFVASHCADWLARGYKAS